MWRVLTFKSRETAGERTQKNQVRKNRRDVETRHLVLYAFYRVVVAAGGGLIICVSPYFWKRSADGARCGPLAETCFPASVARGPSRIAHISQLSHKCWTRQLSIRPRVPVPSKIALVLVVSQRPFAHEAGARISKKRDGSGRSSTRLDTLTASSPLFV